MIFILRKLYNIYLKLVPQFEDYFLKELGGCNSVLDLGCGSKSPLRFLKRRIYSIGVDAFAPAVKKSKKAGIHSKYVKADIAKIKINSKSVDCVIAIDVLEHLSKEDGLELISKMEGAARKGVVIFTPNGFLHQHEFDKNKWQIHKSGWSVDELRKMGYSVKGVNGLKWLRTERANIRFRPKILWMAVSDFSQYLTYFFPKLAFQLLCVKRLQ